jgi:hypothetical protein
MKMRSLLITSAIACAGIASAAPTSSTPAVQATHELSYLAPEDAPRLPAAPRLYHPPEGFAGHEWGDTRASFERLPEQPLNIRAAWTRGKLRTPEFTCMSGVTCTVDDVLNSMAATKREFGGFHVLSEYKIESQGFRFGDNGVLLHPVVYQFCANWNSVKREAPPDFDKLNKFCGMRLLFQSESVAQLHELPDDHVTRYELVLAELISHYGKPSGFMTRGSVSIQELADETSPKSGTDRQFRSWRWCPAMDRAMSTGCDSSIVLSIEPETGRALVLFATPPLWQYAYAREHMGEDGDPLFALMHAQRQK